MFYVVALFQYSADKFIRVFASERFQTRDEVSEALCFVRNRYPNIDFEISEINH